MNARAFVIGIVRIALDKIRKMINDVLYTCLGKPRMESLITLLHENNNIEFNIR